MTRWPVSAGVFTFQEEKRNSGRQADTDACKLSASLWRELHRWFPSLGPYHTVAIRLEFLFLLWSFQQDTHGHHYKWWGQGPCEILHLQAALGLIKLAEEPSMGRFPVPSYLRPWAVHIIRADLLLLCKWTKIIFGYVSALILNFHQNLYFL